MIDFFTRPVLFRPISLRFALLPERIDPFFTYISITVSILQWNCRGVYFNYEELVQLLQKYDPVCIWRVSKNLYLALVFTRLLGVTYLSHPRFVVRMDGTCMYFTPLLGTLAGSSSPYPSTCCGSKYSSPSNLYCLFPVSGSWCADCEGWFG